MQRRGFLAGLAAFLAPILGLPFRRARADGPPEQAGGAPPHAAGKPAGKPRRFGMAIQVDRCIGCTRCMDACKAENNVPKEPFFFRTWVEQYTIKTDGELVVRSLKTGNGKPSESVPEREIMRSFFVPKLCNQCDHPPCVQVCPVGATFRSPEGVVLVDEERCIGCRYCIQACPYGARYLHPDTKTADKCTFCYHRTTRDLLPACVEVCPTSARIFGDLDNVASPLTRFKRMKKIHTLKPDLNTEPKVLYSDLDGVVR
ncbi:MAG: 4Fe-4S dicluster domain-containing protein [Planctomycetes bacterium]|nr:4Fe-4S dicluster domain-containing protein [Planctomycetota bacterium]